MKLTRRFTAICLVALAVLVVVLGAMITRFYEQNALDGARRYVTEEVRRSVLRNFEPSDFAGPKTGAAYDLFWENLSDVLDLPGVIAANAYSADGTLIWSDDEQSIGRRSEQDPSLREALGGNPAALIAPLNRRNHGPSGAPVDGEAIDLYIPVRFETVPGVAGVIELHMGIGLLESSIRRVRYLVWGTLVGGFGLLFGLLYGLVRRGNRLIAKNQEALRRSRAQIETQRMELLSRIGTAAMRETDPSTVIREIARDVRGLLEVPRVTVRLFGAPDIVTEETAPGIPSAIACFPTRPDRGSRPAFRFGERIVVSDAREFAPADEDMAELWAMVRLGSLLAVPVRVRDEEPAGMLVIERSDRHEWTADEIATADAVARQVGIAMRHVRIFREQQELAGRLTSLMSNVPGLVYRGLPDWTLPVIGANAAFIIGYAPETFTRDGKTWKDIVHPDDLPGLRDRIREAVRRKERVLRLEYRIVHKDGSVRWASDRRQMIYDADGRLLCVDGLVLDITDRRKAEEALRMTQFSVDRAGDAAYWMDESGRLLYVNEQACRVLGYARDELLAMTIHDVNPDFPPEVWADHWEDLRARRSYTFESRHRARDGRTIPVEITVNYLEFDGRGYNCVSARDITERKKAQEESRLLQEQLLQSQKMEALGLLAGGIAHDFNNLLTGILGYANLLLLRAEPGSEVATAASVIQRAAERASDLTAQLLGFARKGKHLAVSVDIHRVVDDVAVLLDRTMGRRVSIRKSYRAGSEGTVGDPGQLHQVVMNLAVNAYEAMPDGGELAFSTAVVDLDERYCRSHPEVAPGRYLRLTVTDTGRGIPPEIIGKVFDPFFTTKDQGKGTGLGLATVFGIVKNHGGAVDVESRFAEGAAFSVYLPAVAISREGPKPVSATPFRAGFRGGRRGRILVIDDQESVREVCAAMLSLLGYEVTTASDGRQGLDYYREHSGEIDLVIVDMVMPVMGGRDCFRGMREINPAVRAILSTGYTLEGGVQAILSEGMVGFIQKPYRLDQIAETVAKAMGRDS